MIKTVLKSVRMPFLTLTPVCVLLGISVAAWQGLPVDMLKVTLLLVGALSAHISVNTFNEYFDYLSGLDQQTERTPFSGGSGGLVENPLALQWVRWAALLMLLVTIGIGVYFVATVGWLLLPLGLIGVMLIYFYTGWINQHPLICLFAPGLGFGSMVTGSYFVISGHYHDVIIWCAAVVFWLVNNLLLLNQFPDVEADMKVGRRHFPIVIGRQKSSYVFVLFLLAAFLTVFLMWTVGVLSLAGCLVWLTSPVAVYLAVDVIRNAENPNQLLPAMGLNVALIHVLPLWLALSYFLG